MDAHEQLRRALIERGGAGMRVVADRWRDWASATFDGARHVLTVEGGDLARLCEGIEEAEFRLADHLVADVAVVERAPGRAVIEALTVAAA